MDFSQKYHEWKVTWPNKVQTTQGLCSLEDKYPVDGLNDSESGSFSATKNEGSLDIGGDEGSGNGSTIQCAGGGP